MPTISRFYGIVIAMYFDDHGAPHFHARHAGTGAKIRLIRSRSSTATSNNDSFASSSPGQSCIAPNYSRTGDAPGPVRHYWRSSTGLTPDVTVVSVVRHGVVRLTFADGPSGEVDVLSRMHGPVFADALTLTGFAAVRIDPETGTIVWPGGADLAPDTFYEQVSTGLWPDQHAAAWL